MTGPERYRRAERLIEEADVIGPGAAADHMLAAAQVHATLAVAAATGRSADDAADWTEVLTP